MRRLRSNEQCLVAPGRHQGTNPNLPVRVISRCPVMHVTSMWDAGR